MIGALAAVVLCAAIGVATVFAQCIAEPVPGANKISSFSEKCTRMINKSKTEKHGFKWSVELEAGTEPLSIVDFYADGAVSGAAFVPGTDTGVTAVPGVYKVLLTDGDGQYESWLLVEDTMPPVVETADVTVTVGEKVAAQKFVTSVSDVSAVTVAYAEEPDFEQIGGQDVMLVVSDAGGNEVRVLGHLVVRENDATPPVISGAMDQSVTIGETVMYRSGVSAVDDVDGEVDFEVDTSAVDPATAGIYPVTYTAVDAAGNVASVTVNFEFVEPVAEPTTSGGQTINPADYNLEELTRKVYNKIINESMTPYEKAEAIYTWTRYQIAYVGWSDKSNWETGAIMGFVTKRGDCFTYYATAKALLQMAGIPTVDVKKIVIEGRSRHYWLLVDVGEGWYHFDSCPRRTGGRFFLWTDAQMLEYSEQYNDCFDFDLRLYPRTPGTIPDRFLIKFYPEWFDANGNRLVDANGNLAGTAGYTPTVVTGPTTGTEVAPGAETVPNTEPGAETVPGAEPGTEAVPEAGTETEVVPGTEPETGGEPVTEPEAETGDEPVAEPEADAGTEPVVENETETGEGGV